jgi:periplasmic copper chaperone A
MMKRVSLLACFAILSATATLAGDVMVMAPYARASLTPTAKTGAAYADLMNHGAGDDTLLSITSPAAARVELHESVDENGVMKMRAVEKLVLAPHATVHLAPGGTHLMMFDLVAPLKAGDALPFTLVFEKAGAIDVTIPVKAMGDVPEAHEHVME